MLGALSTMRSREGWARSFAVWGTLALALCALCACTRAKEAKPSGPKAGARLAVTVPDAPEEISAEEVAADLEAARGGADPARNDAEALIARLALARSSRAVMHVRADALRVIQALPEHDQPRLLARLAAAPLPAPGGTLVGSPPVPEADCNVGFDDPEILAEFPDAAQWSFAIEPWIQQCTDVGRVHVEITTYMEWHLPYEDSTIGCSDDGNIGRLNEDGECVALDDPAAEPRKFGSHAGDEWVSIWVEHLFVDGGPHLPFNMLQFTNLGPAVKFRYRKSGQWFQWASLAGNLVWDVSEFVTGVIEVQISLSQTAVVGPDWEAAFPDETGSGPPFFLDDFVFTD